MPDVIIKGMEKIPMACCECPCVNGNFCGAKNERPTFEECYERKPDWCPLHPAPEWISVEKRLPDNEQDVLAYINYGEETRIAPCNYAYGVWFDCMMDCVVVLRHVTHWMPLPEPPGGGDGDG